jgi:hypothetical protein
MRGASGEPAGHNRSHSLHRSGTENAKTKRVGARFPSSRILERYEEPGEEPEAEPRAASPAESPEESRAEPEAERGPRVGARFPSAKALDRYGDPEEDDDGPPTEPVPVVPPATPLPPKRPVPPDYAQEPVEDAVEPRTRVRPYVLTKGRTRYAHNLAIETLVSLEPGARWEGPALHTEYQPVRALCTVPRSVAEVAALLSVPLGVARVLLSDMADLRLVRIHGTTMTETGRPPMMLMRRVLEGLHRL